MVALEDIGGQVCEPIASFSDVYYALQSDFITIQAPKKICDDDPLLEATSYEQLAEIATAHVFKTGKCFKVIDFITESAPLKSTQIGEVERSLFSNELVCEVADSNAKILGFQRYVKNNRFVVLAKETGSGRVRQLGSTQIPARFSAQEHNVEGGLEGKNGATLTITDKWFGPAPIYKGAILLTPAVAVI
jgi:hypothetical protein